ncbi:hypothetical protein J5N97_021552 [Dioscorea zingiberensis]|uniref:Rab3 GTPase-activating protein catalytic subunit n=1 Tax=Dioscorea zingiberensis TaxID=325984 RepID=A0A9D5C963_9LILI|nr:hypothetical protein J5N97_021552 [Dioscorea zingiberensis]
MSVNPAPPSSHGNLDEQISQLMQCKPLSEQEFESNACFTWKGNSAISRKALEEDEKKKEKEKVNFGMKLTYKSPPFEDDEENTLENVGPEDKSGEENDSYEHIKAQWDDDCPWAEWYSAEDPIKGFELITIWSRKTCDSSMEMAELENASSFDAEKWNLYPVVSPNMIDDSVGKFIGFASQLRLLVAENIGSDNSKPSVVIPPPTARDRVLKELFHDGAQIPSLELENKNSRAIKAIATLWIEFVREVRWCWEESQPLRRMPPDFDIDLSSCLIHQKLHLVYEYKEGQPQGARFWKEVADVYETFLVGSCGRALPSDAPTVDVLKADEFIEINFLNVLGEKVLTTQMDAPTDILQRLVSTLDRCASRTGSLPIESAGLIPPNCSKFSLCCL